MSPLGRRIQQNAADWQITLGLVAAGALVALRLFVVLAILLRGPGDASGLFATQLVVELVLAAALMYGLYRKRFGAALALFILWAVGFAYNWAASGRLLPPLGLIGVLIGVGLFQGVRGTYTYRALARQNASAV